MSAAASDVGAPLSAEARSLRHAVANASDGALARVVAMFDSLPDRREADRLLDAVRPRLRALRPPRPIAMPRLLFLPLDGAIRHPREWRRQDGGLPRSALLVIADAVRAAAPEECVAIEASFAGRSFADLQSVAGAGRALWRLAARVADGLAAPPAWGTTGLSAEDFKACIALAGGVWRHADALWAALAVAREGPPEPLVRELFNGLAPETPQVKQAALETLLLKAAQPGTVAAIAGPSAPGIADRALDRWLEGCTPEVSGADLSAAAEVVEEFLETLVDLEESSPGRRADRRQKLSSLRREVDLACRNAFNEAATTKLLGPLLAAKGPPDNRAIAEMEAAARNLRRLEQAGRQLGGGGAYDATLSRVIGQFGTLCGAGGASLADLARLTEILAGPEAAMRLLDGG
ncbi:hypothetical protein J5Y09_17065 [Roseomonas sp. PWR1]|uniref:Uncharacterized protein n=1 Tax=Roseomonas nitratireducens TaxID=2820810 RepID=A0ABS4AW86_9PROT|nr:hypothetical protein [Neoroseomonas nitratireducens]MBP0465640.1 hypothetical protein [Neoroseomonas nitratireducens]